MPTPAEIKEARESAGLTQMQASNLVGATGESAWRTWQSWELGTRGMPDWAWDLFQEKAGGIPCPLCGGGLVEPPKPLPGQSAPRFSTKRKQDGK